MRKLYLSIVLMFSISVLNGCSFLDSWVYRPDINQGNFITQSSIEKLQLGQTKEQVIYILGTPMLASVFEDNVWYYIFRELPTYGTLSQKSYVLTFGEDGLLSDIKYSSQGRASLEDMDKEGE